MEVRISSQAAPGRTNEDLAFVFDGLVGVLDGVTQPAGLDVGCMHSPSWFVRQLASRLVQSRAQEPSGTLADILSMAIAAVRGDHGTRCDLEHPGTPAASVSLLERNNDEIRHLVLCDCTILLDDGVEVSRVTDDRFETAVATLRNAALIPGTIGSPGHEARVAETTMQKWQLTNQAGGYWIAASSPQAAYEAVTGVVPMGHLRRAALLTDGTSCAVDQFGILDWPGVLEVLTDAGPAELIRRVRTAELQDLDGNARPRYKRHDDATAAICQFDPQEEA